MPAALLASAASAQTTEDVEVRDQLIANQEALLNVYRCHFNIDTQVVPGGCTNGAPSLPAVEPVPFASTPTSQDIATHDNLVEAQESLLNVYRCQFNIDTQIVPGGCQNGEQPTPVPAGLARLAILTGQRPDILGQLKGYLAISEMDSDDI